MSVGLNKPGDLRNEVNKLDEAARVVDTPGPTEGQKVKSLAKQGLFWIVIAIVALAVMYYFAKPFIADLGLL
ncbi:MAG: hypothetical protein QF486_04960 [Candidatus Woesearchaeota archaeon]|jgi:hypothetical protein|nr:hypothetical protein [Candidatus Woesearchaeota archaeon]MDP7182009.1 hypothetical protein [Candidatus Woesearchaeota archaeon]MDP7198939.1 hypothetical protein [Candidatus Woesearchaeota archaeon]MDP7467317.1 hypothetical protein [Candidatus Woesearchaeota archaeon]MDP7646628.1 hypothetical protein [Candidatus Woesearchaeota archaeon]